MSRPPVRDEEALLRAHERRIRLLERRLAAAGYLPPHEVRYAGTTAERDAFYGVPNTTALRVALANRAPSWYNIDLGWEESYYVGNTAAGLTVPGLISGASAGWYPTGPGPTCVLTPSAGNSTAGGAYVTGWLGSFHRRGGAAWFDATTDGIVIEKAGRYRLSAWTIQQSGSGIAVFALRLLNSAGSTVLAAREHGAEALQGSPVLVPAEYEMERVTNAQTRLRMFTVSGALAVHQATATAGVRGQMIAEYLGPSLVSS